MTMSHLILGVNGSPHPAGATAKLLNAVLEGARFAGGETEVLNLYDLRINPTEGLYSINPNLETVANMPDDDMKALYKKIQRAAGIVFATPNYWALMSGPMKTFIDRLTPLENEYKLTGKIAAFIAVSKENQGGTEFAAISMLIPIVQMGFIIPPFSVLWYPSDAQQAQGTKETCWAFNDAPFVGRNMVKLAERIADMKWFS